MMIVWPIILPLLTAIATLFAWQKLRTQRALSLVGMGAYAIIAVQLFNQVRDGDIVAAQLGGWDAPFGITLVADRLSGMMILLVAIVGLATIIFSTVNIDRQRVALGYYPLVNVLIMGISGAFLTGDMFNLYVWFEVLLISSFVLLALGGDQSQLEGTFKYVIINLVSSAIFLSGLGLLYGVAGTLNMANLAQVIPAVSAETTTLIPALATIFIVAFGVKAALFPFFFWMPASYHTPPVSISALFAGLLTKVGVYSLVRTFTLIFVGDWLYTHMTVLIVLAGITMVTGVFGAMSQMQMRRILAFHSISQVGYMMMGLALAFISPLALAGTIVFIAHHSLVKSNLFLISGAVRWLRGSDDLHKLGGLLQTRPYLSTLFFLTAMSLAGIPPLSGFWSKFLLVKAGLDVEQYVITAVALFTGVWTLYSMTKIWSYAFWQSPKHTVALPIDYSTFELGVHLLPIVVLVVLVVWMGISAEAVITFAQDTADQLLKPTDYINAVLGNP